MSVVGRARVYDERIGVYADLFESLAQAVRAHVIAYDAQRRDNRSERDEVRYDVARPAERERVALDLYDGDGRFRAICGARGPR